MTNNKRSLTFRYLFIFIVMSIPIGFDIYIYRILSSVEQTEFTNALYITIAILNVIYFLLTKIIIGKRSVQHKYDAKILKPILDALTIIKPTQVSDTTSPKDNDESQIDELVKEGDDIKILKPLKYNHVQITYDKKINFEKYIDAEDTFALEQQQNGWQAILDNFKTYAENYKK